MAKKDTHATDVYEYGVYHTHNRHTCILVHTGERYTEYIPMEASAVQVLRMENKEFARTYTPRPDYPVRRAAEIYLHAPSKVVAPKAREHLQRILADPAFVYDSSQFNLPPLKAQLHKEEDPIMATKKTAPAKKTAAAEPVQPTKKTAKAAAAPVEKTRGRPRDDSSTYTVADSSSVKRGFIADFVAEATKLGSFTRDKLVSKFKDTDEAKLLRYFYYCTGKGIFAVSE